MEATAKTLSAVAHEADEQAHAASLSSEATSANIKTVAGAADQLGESIYEINARAAEAHSVVHRATEIARPSSPRQSTKPIAPQPKCLMPRRRFPPRPAHSSMPWTSFSNA
jgi:hypothetical protein